MKIVFTGGGTGGHIFPIVAITRELRKLAPEKELKFWYLGPADKFAKEILTDEQINVKFLLCGKIRRYFSIKSFFQNLFDFLKIPLGILQAFFYLILIRPHLIFSKGGYGSFPVVICGWILGIRVFLHESDLVPGLANKILFNFAVQIFTSFPPTPQFPKEKIIIVGNPIRREILTGTKIGAQKEFLLSGKKPVVLVLGGSQGAQRLNEKIVQCLPLLLSFCEIIHQTGKENLKAIRSMTDLLLKKEEKLYYHPYGFLNEEQLANAYAVADLVVARAGSGTIFEIAAAKKPSILIPLPDSAQRHQIKNAYFYAKTGAAIVLEEENFSPYFFVERIKDLLSHPEELKKMSEAAAEFAKPLAGKIIAAYFLEIFSGKI